MVLRVPVVHRDGRNGRDRLRVETHHALGAFRGPSPLPCQSVAVLLRRPWRRQRYRGAQPAETEAARLGLTKHRCDRPGHVRHAPVRQVRSAHVPVSDARPGRARRASVRLIAGHSPVRSVRCASVRVLGVQQSPPCVGPATGLVQPIRLSTDYMHSRAQALLGSRAQALPGSRAHALPWYPCSPRGASEGGGAARRAGGPSSATHG